MSMLRQPCRWSASKKGPGACLIQNGKVVCYASRAFTKTEQNYQNLEREALATIWGMEKFHYFLYGKEFTLETDQKPLVSIYKKHMVDISPRVQRLIVRSFPYPAFPCCLQERKRHSSCRCTQLSNPNGPRRKHPVTYHCSQHDHLTHLNECTSSGYIFQEVRLTEEEYSTRRSTHKTQQLHQHRLPL